MESIVRLVTQLEDRIEDLTSQRPSKPQRTIIAQSEEIKRLKHTLEEKTALLLESNQLNYQLQIRIRELEKSLESETTGSVVKNSHNSNLPPSLDPPWKKPKRTRSLRKKSGCKVGGQPGHKGTTLVQTANPDRIIIHFPETCGHCGVSLISTKAQSFQKRQVFEIAGGKLSVTEHQANIKVCPVCFQSTKGNFPTGVKAPVQYGSSVFSRLVYLNLYQLLPVARTAEAMRDLFQCPVSLATVQRAAKSCSSKLVRCEQRIKAAIRESDVMGADETGIRINGETAWVHVARTDTLTHLAPHTHRGKAAFDAIGIINQFKGTLVRDGWFSYQQYNTSNVNIAYAMPICCVI